MKNKYNVRVESWKSTLHWTEQVAATSPFDAIVRVNRELQGGGYPLTTRAVSARKAR